MSYLYSFAVAVWGTLEKRFWACAADEHMQIYGGWFG
jgi:hypothetical protein